MSFSRQRLVASITMAIPLILALASPGFSNNWIQGSLYFAPAWIPTGIPGVSYSTWPVVRPNTRFEITTHTGTVQAFQSNVNPAPRLKNDAFSGGTIVTTLTDPASSGPASSGDYYPIRYDYLAVLAPPPRGTFYGTSHSSRWLPGDPVEEVTVVVVSTGGKVGTGGGCSFTAGDWDCPVGSEPVMMATVGPGADQTEPAVVEGSVYRIDEVAQLNIAAFFGEMEFDLGMIQELGAEAAHVAGEGGFSAFDLTLSTLQPGETLSIPTGEASTSAADLLVIHTTANYEMSTGTTEQWLAMPNELFMSSVPEPGTSDFNADGLTDIDDIDLLIMEIAAGTNDPTYDLDGDELVDVADRDEWLAQAGALNLASGNPYLLGDINLDAVVDVSDFNSWNANKFSTSGTWSGGDLNADGITDVSDFNLWNASKFTASDGVFAVPEPASCVFVVLAGLALSPLVRRSKR